MSDFFSALVFVLGLLSLEAIDNDNLKIVKRSMLHLSLNLDNFVVYVSKD